MKQESSRYSNLLSNPATLSHPSPFPHLPLHQIHLRTPFHPPLPELQRPLRDHLWTQHLVLRIHNPLHADERAVHALRGVRAV